MKQHLSVVTLGVRDLERSKRFYAEGLGWSDFVVEGNSIFFELDGGSSSLALYPWDELADDAAVEAGGDGFRGITLAYGVGSETRVDEVLAEALSAGATLVKPAQRASWGGYHAYFADPDGHLWEVVTLQYHRAE